MLILSGALGVLLLGMVTMFSGMVIHWVFGIQPDAAGNLNLWVFCGCFVFWISMLLWWGNRK